MNAQQIQIFYFLDDGVMPNHPDFPVIWYIAGLKGQTRQMESIFNQNNWLNSWTNGVFGYHHYHSNAHEVLGVIRGSAVLQLGGEHGQKAELHAGDIVVLPAGTAHKRLASSSDFQVVGAYPDGMDYNLHTGKAGERPGVLEEIQRVPIPATDPVHGRRGPLIDHWKKK